MPVDKYFFRQVMGRFTTGVTVVTTRSTSSGLAGITVNSFCSVSLDPPLVLVCIDCKSRTLANFRESGVFAVNILTDQQEHLSRCFATSSPERFEHFCYARFRVIATGSPIIEDAMAFIDARIVNEYAGGDHAIFLGQVVALGTGEHIAFMDEQDGQRSVHLKYGEDANGDTPLTYYQGQYRHLAEEYQKPSLDAQDGAQALLFTRNR